ncbi:MAG: ADOP family duplicated permease [Vicinamibacterales bacterium]
MTADMLKQDLTFAFRLFRREPAIVAVTVGGLALAIAVATAVFSIVNALALRPIGLEDPTSAVRVWREYRNGASTQWTYNEYVRLREASRLSRVEALIRESAPVAAAPDDQGVSTDVHLVSGGYFSTFDGRVTLGRPLTESDDVPGGPEVAVVNHGFWRRRLGGEPSVVGRVVYFFGRPVTIVGVADRKFTGPVVESAAFWLPLGSAQTLWSSVGPFHAGSTAPVSITARLAAGVSSQAAQSELAALAASIADPAPEKRPLTSGAKFAPADNRGDTRMLVAVVMTAVALVLLLACVNVANLLLAAATTRRREIGMRLALGAGRRRVVRQLLTESLLLSLTAGALGLLAVVWVLPVILSLVHVPETMDVSPDARVYSFAVLVAIIAGVGAGLAPAHAGSRSSLLAWLASDTAHAGTQPRLRRLRSFFVAVQAAASIMLLVVAALLTRAERHVMQRDVGFDVERLAVVNPGFARGRYAAGQSAQYWETALARVKGLPGVEAAALVEHPPFGGSTRTSRARRGLFLVHLNRTSGDYFRTAGIPLFAGRSYTAAEHAIGAPVAVVSRSVAYEFWGSDSPLGHTLTRVSNALSGVQVIGVAEDIAGGLTPDSTRPTIYQPLGPDQRVAALIVRSRIDPAVVIAPVRAALLSIDPTLAPNPWLVRNGLSLQMQRVQALSALGQLAGLLALGLAVTGIFGVTAFVVSRRVPEIGIRMALGASRKDVTRLLTRDALRPVIIGLAAGILVALLGTGVMAAVLHGISPRDPLAIAGAACVLLIAAYIAVLVPVRRATRINPASLLRQH